MGLYKSLAVVLLVALLLYISHSGGKDGERVSEGVARDGRPTTPSLTHLTSAVGIDTLLVIPGGGTSGPDGYPSWTKTRTEAAFAFYQTLSPSLSHSLTHSKQLNASGGEGKRHMYGNVAFLALSAGSLNVASGRQADGRMIFECSAVMRHLTALGVPASRVFGDTFSWDTVTNGLTLRMYTEALLDFNPHKSSILSTPKHKLNIHIFISDFHAARTQASFEWILDLEPSLTHSPTHSLSPHVMMTIHSLPSLEFGPEERAERDKHEAKGLLVIQKNRENVRTMSELYQFLLLGGHGGLDKYLRGTYSASTTVGYH